MEVINDYIKIFDNVLEKNVLETFTKICKNNMTYSPAGIFNDDGSEAVNPSIRNVMAYTLSNIHDSSLTNSHWASYLFVTFTKYIQEYKKNMNALGLNIKINDMQVLKYKKNGHYKFHVDDGSVHRILSLIYFVNDNYEGGNLCFKLLNSQKVHEVKKVSNRLIIWPSNFMYPHTVTPVTKGERFSVVAWAS